MVWREWGVLSGYKVSFWDENVLELDGGDDGTL